MTSVSSTGRRSPPVDGTAPRLGDLGVPFRGGDSGEGDRDVGTEDFRITPLQPAGGVIVIQVSGEVDITSALAFKERLFAALDEAAARVVVDLDAADYVDTTGLSVLLELAKRCRRDDRALAIVCCEGLMRRALANTGLDQIVTTYDTLDEALGHGGQAR
jgi:anti-sigma B factor antagonist